MFGLVVAVQKVDYLRFVIIAVDFPLLFLTDARSGSSGASRLMDPEVTTAELDEFETLFAQVRIPLEKLSLSIDK